MAGWKKGTRPDGTRHIVYCSKCEGIIANIPNLMTPTTFKEKYGEACPHCGYDFSNKVFKKYTGNNPQKTLEAFNGDP